jgi:hypothetical protein
MKKILFRYVVIGMALFGAIGCSSTWKLPSVTLGGAANKNAILGADLSKKGMSVTAPLVNVDVPFPSVSKKDVD